MDSTYQNKIGERITRRLAQAMQDGEVNEEQFTQIGTFVLDNLGQPRNSLQVFHFLVKLANKWPLFSTLLTVEQAHIDEAKDSQAIQQVSEMIEQEKLQHVTS